MNKKKIILIICSILIGLAIIFLIGNSFGFFKYMKKGDLVNIITINGIKVEIVNDNDSLNLNNAYPISDSEGLNLEPFEFKMINNSNSDINYSIKVVADTDKLSSCQLDDGTNCPELSTSYIKFAYKKEDGSYTEPQLLSSNNNIVSSGTITANGTITSSLVVWIDKNSGNEIMNHYFYGKLIIEGSQA